MTSFSPLIIDGHEDLAYLKLHNNRDFTQSVRAIRAGEPDILSNLATIGWDELQRGKVCIVFGTVFLEPSAHLTPPILKGQTGYTNAEECHKAVIAQLDLYQSIADSQPEKFSLIRSCADLHQVLSAWNDPNAQHHPTGLIALWEGAEGLRSFEDLDEYYERGMRMIGPVWGGGRWCGGTFDTPASMGLTSDGREFLSILAEKRFVLDTAHMNTRSANDALEHYEGVVIASHCNCRQLLRNPENERHFTDETIARLIARGGVMGVVPFNGFLSTEWKEGDDRARVTLQTLTDHIDHICQLAGNADHAAIGTDFDGGFGYPNIPLEMADISSLSKLARILQDRGYTEKEIEKICSRNWLRILESALP